MRESVAKGPLSTPIGWVGSHAVILLMDFCVVENLKELVVRLRGAGVVVDTRFARMGPSIFLVSFV